MHLNLLVTVLKEDEVGFGDRNGRLERRGERDRSNKQM